MAITVGIDARAAAEVPAGRGRYVRELLTALDRLGGDERYALYAREPWGDLDPKRFAWRPVTARDPLWHLMTARRADRECDVFLSTNSYLTAWFTRIPTAVVVYDLVPWTNPDTANRRSATIERATIRPALRRCAALPCISEATRIDLVRRFPIAEPKASVIPLAADATFADPVPAPGHHELKNPYVLAVGTLEPRKNLERLIDAWVVLPPDVRGAHELALVGPRGWDEDGILRKAIDHGARLLGHVTEDELRALYAGASAFVYPSLYEGFGLPVLEAMAAGAPVITSNVSSLPEVAGDAALLIDPHDTAAIATAITELLSDTALSDSLRRRGRERAALYSWQRTAAETRALLTAIAAQ